MTSNVQLIEATVHALIDPYTQQTLGQTKSLKSLHVSDNTIQITVTLGYPTHHIQHPLSSLINETVGLLCPAYSIAVTFDPVIISHKIQHGLAGIQGIKNIIAVASGKGGVGKSTVSANLAIALSQAGARVGLLDADIYGPSQPLIFGITTSPTSTDKKSINPIIQHGVQTMSIGYLIDTKTPMIWRGPMVSTALQQLLNDTRWDNLDYLIIDLPPGTGDIQLTMSQKIPVSGAVIVTTPQDLALLDARRAIGMFEKVHIPVLGIIENMSVYHCPHCGHSDAIFGETGGEKIATEYHTQVLGKLPLDKQIREDADLGAPSVARHPDSSIANEYRQIAVKLAAKLSLQAKNFAGRFPKIVVEN